MSEDLKPHRYEPIVLPAEIKARRQQYEYYRNRLLSFREAT